MHIYHCDFRPVSKLCLTYSLQITILCNHICKTGLYNFDKIITSHLNSILYIGLLVHMYWALHWLHLDTWQDIVSAPNNCVITSNFGRSCSIKRYSKERFSQYSLTLDNQKKNIYLNLSIIQLTSGNKYW